MENSNGTQRTTACTVLKFKRYTFRFIIQMQYAFRFGLFNLRSLFILHCASVVRHTHTFFHTFRQKTGERKYLHFSFRFFALLLLLLFYCRMALIVTSAICVYLLYSVWNWWLHKVSKSSLVFFSPSVFFEGFNFFSNDHFSVSSFIHSNSFLRKTGYGIHKYNHCRIWLFFINFHALNELEARRWNRLYRVYNWWITDSFAMQESSYNLCLLNSQNIIFHIEKWHNEWLGVESSVCRLIIHSIECYLNAIRFFINVASACSSRNELNIFEQSDSSEKWVIRRAFAHSIVTKRKLIGPIWFYR